MAQNSSFVLFRTLDIVQRFADAQQPAIQHDITPLVRRIIKRLHSGETLVMDYIFCIIDA